MVIISKPLTILFPHKFLKKFTVERQYKGCVIKSAGNSLCFFFFSSSDRILNRRIYISNLYIYEVEVENAIQLEISFTGATVTVMYKPEKKRNGCTPDSKKSVPRHDMKIIQCTAFIFSEQRQKHEGEYEKLDSSNSNKEQLYNKPHLMNYSLVLTTSALLLLSLYLGKDGESLKCC